MSQEQHNPHSDKKKDRKGMSRRQFLSYTLGGTGAFMIGVPLLFNLRFAVDPLLKKEAKGSFIKVVEESKIKTEPATFTFQKHIVDGWYESDQSFNAWIAKDEKGNIFALSPTCKHLGCTVNWNTDPAKPEQYACPCHGAHYTKDGKNLVVAPAPLDEFEVKVQNGWVYLGPIKPNSRV
jgi:menaquinol-cytochrome c reductase iron-sulfur subunit